MNTVVKMKSKKPPRKRKDNTRKNRKARRASKEMQE